VSARVCHVAEGEGEGGIDAGSAAEPRGRDGSGWHCRRRQRALMVEASWRTGEGGGAQPTQCGHG
jgi:hypothetical protein